jgi:hypothetical protein
MVKDYRSVNHLTEAKSVSRVAFALEAIEMIDKVIEELSGL